MKSAFAVDCLSSKPGSVSCGYLPFGYLNDSTPVQIPVILVNGAEPGPTLWLSSTMHGIEIGGIEVIRRVTREITNPGKLRGQIIAWPILNPLAFRDAMTNTPQDLVNINRIFPGGPKQLVTHRLADLITRHIPVADYFIDFHANVAPSLVHSIVKRAPDRAVRAKSLEMARAFGATLIFAEAHIESTPAGATVMGGSFTECTIRAGKPTVTVELNNSRRLDPVSVEAGVRGVCNVMRLLGMVDGEVVKQDVIQVFPDLYSRAVVISDKGGLVNILKGPGEPVTKGEVFLQIRNPFGDLVDEVVSPVTGYVLAYPMQKNQAAGTGDYLAFLITPYLGDFLGA